MKFAKNRNASALLEQTEIKKEDFNNNVFKMGLKPQEVGLLAYLVFKNPNAFDLELLNDFFIDRRTLNKILDNISKKIEKQGGNNGA